jgi:hypothetical protein
MRIANASNGLAFPPYDDVSMFLSQYGHSAKKGYFRIDSMPHRATMELLRGGTITIIDATRRHKTLTDGLKFGLTTWCLVFNRAIKCPVLFVAPWQTREMINVANSPLHKPTVQAIRRLSRILGSAGPAIIGESILIEMHQGFIGDDKPRRIREMCRIDNNSQT